MNKEWQDILKHLNAALREQVALSNIQAFEDVPYKEYHHPKWLCKLGIHGRIVGFPYDQCPNGDKVYER